VGAALLASAEGYTPRATKLIDEARERLGTIQEVALALAENLPAPKQGSGRSRRRRRRRRKGGGSAAANATQAKQNGASENQPEQPPEAEATPTAKND
jgi:hypothetical protein